MNLIKRLISSVLCVALIVSLLVIPSVAVDDGLFSISFSAQDNYTYDEQNEVTSVKAGDTFYLFVNFAGNTEERNVYAMGVFIRYNPELISINAIQGQGPIAGSVVVNPNYSEDIAMFTWSGVNGLTQQVGFDDLQVVESGQLAVMQCTAKDDLTESDFASIEFVTEETKFGNYNGTDYYEYNASDLTLPILVPNSVLVYTNGSGEIAAPKAEWDEENLVPVAGTKSVTYEALVTDGDGDIVEDPALEWAIDGDPAGVSVEGGVITVESTAAAGDYTVKATYGGQSAESTFSVTKETPEPGFITGDEPDESFDPNIEIPAEGKDVTVQFSGKVWDQYGVEMSSGLFTWKIEPDDVAGVSISDTGLLTITNEAKGAITDTTGKPFTVKGTCGEMSLTTDITVKRAASVVTSVDIYKGEAAVTSDTIAIPQSGSSEATYTAKVLDQYGSEMADEVTWRSEGSITGVTVSNGTVTVPAGASTGSILLKATSGSVSGSVNINVASISFGDEDTIKNALTISDTPTYGMTWGDIVKVTGEISANVGGTPVEGTYSVKDAGDTPDAGEDKEYKILFTSTDGTYSGVEVYTGTVTIAPQVVTVKGITVGDKKYDGNNTATVNYTGEGVSVTGTIGEDVVTVTGATGMFADANAGTDKPVTVEVTLDNGNYTVEDFELKADITAKTLTADVTNVDVSKVYDGTTAPGTVSGSASVTGTVGSETVTVNVTAGNYPAKDVKSDYTVELTLELTGDAAKNYVLSSNTATIRNAAITARSEFTDATSTSQNVVVGVGTFAGPSFTGIGGEAVTGTVTYTYDGGEMDKADIESALARLNAGAAAAISYSFAADGNYSGEKAGTITVTMVDIAFDIDDGAITVKNDAVYGGTWADIVTVDASKITAAVGTEKVEGTYTVENSNARPNAGTSTYKVLFTSTDGRYMNVEVASGTVNVAKKSVTITGLKVENKEYDGDADAAVTGTAALDGVLADDNVTVIPGNAVFESKDVGINKTVDFSGYSLSGMDAGNYTLSAQPSATASITPKPVTITGVGAANKNYDGTTAAGITGTASIDGLVTGDDVYVVEGSAAFASADVGTGITVTFSGFSLSGAGAGNYELTAQPESVTADINKANYTGAPELDINIVMNQAEAQTGTLTALNFFGGNMPAGATITAVALSGTDSNVIEGISVDDGSLTYASEANITTEGAVETYNVTVSTKNYNDITATLTFTTVAKTPVTISGVSVADKVYNGQAAFYTGTPAAAADGEAVEVSAYTYTWQSADGAELSSAPVNTGSYKLVIAVAENDPNYVGSTTVNFTISKATVTITVADKEAYVGSDMPDFSYTVSGLAAGETLAAYPTLTCSADMDEPSEYAITASGAAVPATGNYNETITYVPGTLTVSRRPINVGPTYDIDVADSENGSVKASLSNASEGSVITLTVTPDEGYRLGSITVIDENGNEVEVRRSGSEYKFTMPDGDVRVSTRFVRDTGALPFNDVKPGDWFYEYVAYVYNNGIMDGVSTGEFSPNTATTRGMVVTVLYRLYGEPAVSGGSSFTDVAPGAYYADAVAWASNAGIVNGTSGTTFSPNDLVTREQFAAMLYRYMQYTGADTSARASLSGFADAGKVSPYAADALAWAVAEGVLNGRSATEIAPQGNCTRAEVAAMITRVFG